jgi:hypothetical protein
MNTDKKLHMSDVTDSLIMYGKLHAETKIIKYDGSNKEYIINELKIKNYTKSYFSIIPSYFIIPPDKDEWFILDQCRFNDFIQRGILTIN